MSNSYLFIYVVISLYQVGSAGKPDCFFFVFVFLWSCEGEILLQCLVNCPLYLLNFLIKYNNIDLQLFFRFQ